MHRPCSTLPCQVSNTQRKQFFWRRWGFRAWELGVDLGTICIKTVACAIGIMLYKCQHDRRPRDKTAKVVAGPFRFFGSVSLVSCDSVEFNCLPPHVASFHSVAFPSSTSWLRSSGSTAVRSATLCYVPLCVPCILFYSVVAFRSGLSAWPLSCLCPSRDS